MCVSRTINQSYNHQKLAPEARSVSALATTGVMFVLRCAAGYILCFLLLGCASTQLNFATLDLGESVSDIQKKQVLHNLSLFIDDPAAFPIHIDLQSGGAQVTNTIQPTLGAPLGATQLIQSTVSTAMGGSVANQLQSTRPGATLSVEAQNAQQQSWTYDPIVDGKELLRLRALYRYADGVLVHRLDSRNYLPCGDDTLRCAHYNDASLKQDFPVFRKSVTVTYSNIKAITGTSSGNIYCPDIGLNSQVVSSGRGELGSVACASVSTAIETPDDNTFHYPNCILCLNGGNKLGAFNGQQDLGQLGVNKTLKELAGGDHRTRWLFTERDQPLPADYESLGHYGRHDLFIAKSDRWKLSEFTMFVLMATAQTSAESSAAGGGGGGGAGGGKKGNGGPQIQNAPAQLL